MLTIDDYRTRDMDDAIEVDETADGWTVRVAIADASRLIAQGSDLDKAARERGRTLYFAAGTSPMLPREISEWELSLWPNKRKHVIGVEVRLSSGLAIEGARLSLETIKSSHKLAYAQIPALLASPDTNGLPLLMRTVSKLALGLLKKRREDGALVFYDLNNGWVTTEEGSIRKLKDHTETIGYIIVQEMMVLANTAVALYAIEHQLPMLFRNHEVKAGAFSDRAEIQKFIADGAMSPVIDLEAFQRRTHRPFKKAAYGATVTGHAGLSVAAYAHFTSPIRRYADLVVHQQIRAHLKGEPLPHTEESLAATAAHLNELAVKERESASAHFKGLDERRALRQAEARNLDGLIPKQFERVVKVETRSGEPPSAALVETWSRRLAAANVPTVCMTVALMHGLEAHGEGLRRAPIADGWDVIKSAAIAALAERPPNAVTILTQAAALGWPAVNLGATAIGQAHAPLFSGAASVILDNDPIVVTAYAKTAKAAQQRAAVMLLAELSMVEAPDFGEPEPVALARVARPVDSVSKHPVSLLMERSQAQRLPPPKFDFTMKGDAHLPVVTCSASLGGHIVSAVSASKQEAKTAAAKLLLEKLGQPP